MHGVTTLLCCDVPLAAPKPERRKVEAPPSIPSSQADVVFADRDAGKAAAIAGLQHITSLLAARITSVSSAMTDQSDQFTGANATLRSSKPTLQAALTGAIEAQSRQLNLLNSQRVAELKKQQQQAVRVADQCKAACDALVRGGASSAAMTRAKVAYQCAEELLAEAMVPAQGLSVTVDDGKVKDAIIRAIHIKEVSLSVLWRFRNGNSVTLPRSMCFKLLPVSWIDHS